MERSDYTRCAVSVSISVIIPNLHSPLIGEVVDALASQTERHLIDEILVVGQDRHGLVGPPARHIETPQPVSAARARNLGAAWAQGDYLLFIDSDCIAAPDLVERIVEHLDADAVVKGAAVVHDGIVVKGAVGSSPRSGRGSSIGSCVISARALANECTGFNP
ncbi:MAG: glycosyltransferase family 2 protein [Roseiflexaceae bacterium]|nr:glycosyltransferase family 2 protein [Roseiflexaceae bacterium]